VRVSVPIPRSGKTLWRVRTWPAMPTGPSALYRRPGLLYRVGAGGLGVDWWLVTDDRTTSPPPHVEIPIRITASGFLAL
jgi:hypothetical protein